MRLAPLIPVPLLAVACAPQSAQLTEGSYMAFIDADDSLTIAKEEVDPEDYDTYFNVDCREFETPEDEKALRLPDPINICGDKKWPPQIEQWAIDSGFYAVTEDLDPWRGEAIITSEGDLQIGFHHRLPGGADMRFLFTVNPTFQPTQCVQGQAEGVPWDGNWIEEWSEAELTYIASLPDDRREAFSHMDDFLETGRLYFLTGGSYQLNPLDTLDLWFLPDHFVAGSAQGKFAEERIWHRSARYGEPYVYNAIDAIGATDSTILIDASDVWWCDLAAGSDPEEVQCSRTFDTNWDGISGGAGDSDETFEEHVRNAQERNQTEMDWLTSPTGKPEDSVYAYEPISHANEWRIPDGLPPGFDSWAELHPNFVVFSEDSVLEAGGAASGAFTLTLESNDSSTRVFVKGRFEIDKIKNDKWRAEDLEQNKLDEAGVTLCIDS